MQIKKNAIDVDDDGKEEAKNFFDFLLTQQKLFQQTAAECSGSGGKININQWQFAI